MAAGKSGGSAGEITFLEGLLSLDRQPT
ncbi:hypothetical protein VULLAG_LOCUS16036 [Vulpes lagopus]